MAKVQLEPVLNMIETMQVFADVYDYCEYEETKEELIKEIKTKINQLDRVVRLIKNNYEKELKLDALSPEERRFEEFIERCETGKHIVERDGKKYEIKLKAIHDDEGQIFSADYVEIKEGENNERIF